jgi:hypothetical protein
VLGFGYDPFDLEHAHSRPGNVEPLSKRIFFDGKRGAWIVQPRIDHGSQKGASQVGVEGWAEWDVCLFQSINAVGIEMVEFDFG